MAFDPDAYLATPFDPDAYLKGQATPPADTTGMTWETLQESIKNLPEVDKVKAVRDWATAQEKQRATDSGVTGYLGDIKRSVVRGIPGGTFADEAQAAISSRLPTWMSPVWSGAGDPYEKTKALEDARLRRFGAESPVTNFVGNVVGGLPFGLTGSLGKRVAFDTAAGAVSGAGEGDTMSERLANAGVGGALSGGMSTLLNRAGNWYNRWTQQSPDVVEAASRQGVDLPFFATAESPKVQAMGRQAGQGQSARPAIASSWEAAQRDVPAIGERMVTGVTGAPVETAPRIAGQAVADQLETATKNISDQVAALRAQTTSRLTPGAKFDMPQLRAELDQLIAKRTGEGIEKPMSGLGQPINLATRPEGATFEGAGNYATRLGQRLGLPELTPRKVTPGEEAPLMRATRGDQERMVLQDVARREGPWSGAEAASTFRQNLPAQRALYDTQRDLASAAKGAPEAIVSKAFNAATVKGAGTRLDDLTALVTSLPPEQQRQLGAGVLAHIQNLAGGSPQGIAQRLASMPQEARNLLFKPGTPEAQQVADLMTLAGRLGDINQLRHVGSPASIAEGMIKNPVYDLLTNPLTMAGQYGLSAAGVPYVAAALPAQIAGWAIPRAMVAANTRLLQKGLPTPAAPQSVQDLATAMASSVARQQNWPVGYGR